ncbi:MAG: DUF3277 family protein [Cytophagaceae bacterium]|nr:MAG: DUF3277 family protein [Cytophagaceae bacterium]
MTVRTYSPSEFSVTVGALILTGFAQDTMITVSRKTPTWSSTAGSDGFVTRARSADKRGDITLTLDMSSPSNDDLTALFAADEMTGKGVFPIMIRDGSGSSVASAASAWIVSPATLEYGNGVVGRAWTFEAANITISNGGNN